MLLNCCLGKTIERLYHRKIKDNRVLAKLHLWWHAVALYTHFENLFYFIMPSIQ